MKKFSTPLFHFILLMVLIIPDEINAQDVGIGTPSPDHKLHVAGNTSSLLKLDNTVALNTGVMSEMYFKTGTHYTGAVKTIGNGTLLARLGFFTYAATGPNGLIERMSIMDNGYVGIGTNTPGFLMDVNGRMRVRNGNGTAGVAFMDAANATNRGLVGMKDDTYIGLYGFNGAGWGLTMNTNSGAVVIESQLNVSSDGSFTTKCINYDGDGTAILAEASGAGWAISAGGGEIGVKSNAHVPGPGSRFGVDAFGAYGEGNNYGVSAFGLGGNNAYGIHAKATNGNTNWAGYFTGNVYSTGSYQGSDRKLKNDIQPLDHALQLLKQLKPATYTYKTDEYALMEFPQGQQYGLIADEVKQVFPSMVKKAVQPAQYENNDRRGGRLMAEEVSFEAVNYTAMIPVLIAAMQEQQSMIEAQQRKIEELESVMKGQ